MNNINTPKAPPKKNFWGDFKAAWTRATPGQRFGAVLIVGILITLIVFVISLLTPNDSEEIEPMGDSKVGSIGGAIDRDKSLAVIEDTESELGKKLIQAEQARVFHEAQQGRSAIQSLVATNEPSPFDEENQREIQPQTTSPNRNNVEAPKSAPERKDVFGVRNAANVTDSGFGLSQQTLIQLSSADSPKTTLANDPYAGFGSPDEYAAALEQAKSATAHLVGETTKVYQAERTSMSGGIALVAMTNDLNNTDQRNSRNRSQPYRENNATAPDAATKERPPILLNPGDSMAVYIPYEVDSRVPGPFIAIAMTGKLKDARLRCEFTDTGDFIVPTCTEMTLNGKKHPIEAMVINPKTFGRVIDQDIDNDTFLKAVARFGSNALQAFGAAKLAQGITRVEDTDSNTVTTQNNQSDRQIVLGSLAVGLGDLAGSAEEYYQQPSVKTIPANTQMILVMTSQIPDAFGVNERQIKGYTR